MLAFSVIEAEKWAAHICQATNQSLFPAFPSLRSAQGYTFPVISDIEDSIDDPVGKNAKPCDHADGKFLERGYCRFSSEGHSTQVVNESGVNLCNQRARWIIRVMSQCGLKFV